MSWLENIDAASKKMSVKLNYDENEGIVRISVGDPYILTPSTVEIGIESVNISPQRTSIQGWVFDQEKKVAPPALIFADGGTVILVTTKFEKRADIKIKNKLLNDACGFSVVLNTTKQNSKNLFIFSYNYDTTISILTKIEKEEWRKR